MVDFSAGKAGIRVVVHILKNILYEYPYTCNLYSAAYQSNLSGEEPSHLKRIGDLCLAVLPQAAKINVASPHVHYRPWRRRYLALHEKNFWPWLRISKKLSSLFIQLAMGM